MLMQTHEARLNALRKELDRRGLDGFVVPISDEHMSEYVGAYAQRLAWLTGFGGSAGTAAVLKDKAAIFVDGRYTLQVRDQVDGRLYDYQVGAGDQHRRSGSARTPRPGATIGYDPWLHTRGWAKAVATALARARGRELVRGRQQPGRRGVGRPARRPRRRRRSSTPKRSAGRSSADKRADVADWLKDNGSTPR